MRKFQFIDYNRLPANVAALMIGIKMRKIAEADIYSW